MHLISLTAHTCHIRRPSIVKTRQSVESLHSALLLFSCIVVIYKDAFKGHACHLAHRSCRGLSNKWLVSNFFSA